MKEIIPNEDISIIYDPDKWHAPPPDLSGVSDEELLDELKRRKK